MVGLKYLEMTYYKVIIDLIKTLSKYNFTSEDICLKIKNQDTLRTEKISYRDLTTLTSYYKTNAEIIAGSECEYGNDIYLDTIQFNSLIYNSDINFKVLNASEDYLLRKKHLDRLGTYNDRFVSNQSATLTKMLDIYGKIYSYISGTRDASEGFYYSPCYAKKEWTEDLVSKSSYETILKYNLFDLKAQNISKADREAINKIIL